MISVAKVARAGFGLSALVLGSLLIFHTGNPDHRGGQAPQANEALASLKSSRTAVRFGKVPVGESSTQTITLSNRSRHSDLVIDNLFLDEHDSLFYELDKEAPLHLSAGQQVKIKVTFKPTTIREIPGRLILNHSGDYGTMLIDLEGTGIDSDPNAPVIAAAVPGPYPFGKSTLKGFNGGKPTSLQFGPDGKLYVALMDGSIDVLEVERTSENKYKVTDTETINLVKNIDNHDDDGDKNKSIKERLVTGLVVTGTAAKPVIYVHSSDPRIGGGKSGKKTGLDTNSGIISKLTKSGNNWKKLDIVRGLSRSEENHHGNGMVLNASGDKLYLAAGGNTNMGATSNNFALLPEYALSAAILEIDLAQIGDKTYDIPTLDDEDRAGKNDNNDPFGGNKGKNQAMLVAGGPVQVYAPGFRNPYDVVIMENGRMYSWDNGPNSGWGGIPVKNGPKGNCTNGVTEPGYTQHDALHLITGEGYYGGHPNPTRGNKNNTFNKSKPQSPVPYSNAVECEFKGPGTNGNGNKNGSLVSLPASTNGIVEYTASNFGGDMKGSLLATSWNNKLYRVTFKNSGALLKNEALFSNVGSSPLDVTAQGDNAVFPGTIWVANFQSKDIVVFEPDDYLGAGIVGCFAGNGNQDADGDGFSDADENANGTDPCSSADAPADADSDNISDFTDPDDDNDGLDDIIDPFALDATNGAGTDLGVDYQWENDSPPAGFIADLGFSGLMTNSVDDYLDLFDPGLMTVRGAAGVLTVDEVTKGDPINGQNSQEYGFQFGVNVDSASPVFKVHSRILAPFAGFTPEPYQSMGIFIGTGDQDNYLKFTVESTGPSGGLQFAREIQGSRSGTMKASASIFDASYVDLYIVVDPASAIASAYYQVSQGDEPGELVEVGVTDFPGQWLEGSTKLAVGIISTSVGADPFPATWDFISVTEVTADEESALPELSLDVPATLAVDEQAELVATLTGDSDATLFWEVTSGPASVDFSDETDAVTTAVFPQAGSYDVTISATSGAVTVSETATIEVEAVATLTADVVYRINAGGPLLQDINGDWAADNGSNSFANTGKTWSNSATVDLSDVDESLPASLFQSERYDPPGGADLVWQLPVSPGQYEVRLYFSENYIGSMAAGGRVFSVDVEGQLLPDLDIYAESGGKKAVMKSVVVTADSAIDIAFSRTSQNPSIKGIEVWRSDNMSAAEVDGPLNDSTTYVDPADQPDAKAPADTVDSGTPENEGTDEPETVVPVDEPQPANSPPLVDAGGKQTVDEGVTVSLTGGASDDGLPAGSTMAASWKKVSGPGNVLFETASSLATDATFSSHGRYKLELTVSDGELSSSDQVVVLVNEVQPQLNVVYRINAGGPTLSDPSGDWQSDAGSSYVNTGKTWSQTSAVDTSALSANVPEALFKTERYDRSSGPELKWTLPVQSGVYEVRLYFAEIYSGAHAAGKRVFSVDVEGQTLPNLDVYARYGGHTAMMESFTVSSVDGALDIAFAHVVENPAIKGIEVLKLGELPETVVETGAEIADDAEIADEEVVVEDQAQIPEPSTEPSTSVTTPEPSVSEPEVLPVVNMSPQVLVAKITESTDAVAGEPLPVNAEVADDGLPDGVMYALWAKVSGPGDVEFESATSVSTTATFSEAGDYVIALSVNDGVLTTTDSANVTVSANESSTGGQVVYRINAGGPLINDATGDWAADNKDTYANTGKIYKHSNTVDTSSLDEEVPAELFGSERYDRFKGPDLVWKLPVTPGNYVVKLYFAETYKGTLAPGARRFNVDVEGESLAGLDVFSEAGAYTALVKSFSVSSDDSLDISFERDVQNPAIKGIEVRRAQ